MSEPNAPAARTPWGRSVILGVVFSAIVCVVVLAFSWPSVTLDPKGLPVVVTGPEAALQPVEKALNDKADGAFEITEVADRDAAVRALKERDAYGAIVLGDKPEVLTSSAASTATNQMMTQLHDTLQAMVQQQAAAAAQRAHAPNIPTVTVALTDVVPLVPDDPRGAGLTAAALPLVFGGMIGGMLVTFLVNGSRRRVTTLLVYALVGGSAITGIMHSWFGVLGGDFLPIAGAFALTLLAMGATIVGFASVFGRAGVAVGPVLFMLVGNPISGTTFPKEFYPGPWGTVGQYLPPGAGGTLLRDVAYFPDADLTAPMVTLAVWAAAGLLLVLVGHFRNQSEIPSSAVAEQGIEE